MHADGEARDRREGRVCPWWMCFTFDNVFRRMIMNPERIVSPWVHEGDAVLDIGPGRGFFTLPMAALAGKEGYVVAADVQARLLSVIERRADRAGVRASIRTKLVGTDSLDVDGAFDFILAFWMVHETPDRRLFLGKVRSLMKPGGRFLVAEPGMHVSAASFARTEQEALDTGLTVIERPEIAWSRSILFGRGEEVK